MEPPVNEGDLVAGKYAVERVLGDGGMGVVVAARHLELGERVALKFLLPEAAKNPEACLRFVREARAAARIKGEHVARVLDVGTRDDGMPFIVMEYLEGSDLGRLVEARGPLAVSDAVHYLLQACEAVAQAHALGIVHRDLKPENLFLTRSPDGSPLVKVLDFGISKSSSVFSRTCAPSITTVNASMGTPQYMSPEQARDAGTVDARSDVWALGAILYELVAGKPAFDADSVPALVMMIATEEPPALEGLRPDAPPGLVDVVRRCLRKNREDRFADVAELARALEPFGPDEAAPAVTRVARILGQAEKSNRPCVERTPNTRGKLFAWVFVALTALAATLSLGAFVWSERVRPASLASAVVEQPPVEVPPPSFPTPPLVEVAPVTPPSVFADVPAKVRVDSTAPLADRSSASEVPATVRAPRPAVAESATRTSTPASRRSFDPATAATELFAAAGRASACTRPNAPSGSGRATVAFAPSGSAQRVVLSAPFAGSPSEPCLREAFLAARVPRFQGTARTLEQRFRVVAPNEPGTLTFQSNVPAEVALDGRSLGPTPRSVTTAPGSYTVAFIHPELGQKEQAVTVAPGQDKTIRATFLPAAAEQP